MIKYRVQQILFDWTCCVCWQRFAHVVELFIMDAFVDLFITLCIVLNTAFMAVDHAGMSDDMARVLTIGNYVRLSRRPSVCQSINPLQPTVAIWVQL